MESNFILNTFFPCQLFEELFCVFFIKKMSRKQIEHVNFDFLMMDEGEIQSITNFYFFFTFSFPFLIFSSIWKCQIYCHNFSQIDLCRLRKMINFSSNKSNALWIFNILALGCLSSDLRFFSQLYELCRAKKYGKM